MNQEGYFDFGRGEFVFGDWARDVRAYSADGEVRPAPVPGNGVEAFELLTSGTALQFYRVLVQGGIEDVALEGLRVQIEAILHEESR